MADLTAQFGVHGVPGLLAEIRQEVARLIRDAAAAEKDAQVAARLYEVAAAFAQKLSHAEAVERAKVATEHTGLPHFGPSTPMVRKTLDAVGGPGGKATTETLKP